MSIPSDIGLYMLNYAHSLSDYIITQKKFDIADDTIEKTLSSEAVGRLQGSTPIEKLYRLRHPEEKYILIYVFEGRSEPALVGTKSQIIEDLTDGYGAEWDTDKERQEYKDYYMEHWLPHELGTDSTKICYTPLFGVQNIHEGAYYVSGPV